MLVGFAVFVLLLLFSTQLLLRLYASSSLSAAATRAAEQVASSPDPVIAAPGAQAEAVASLGTFGAQRATFTWLEVDGDTVVLRVHARVPQLLPLPGQLTTIDRTVRVRTERFR